MPDRRPSGRFPTLRSTTIFVGLSICNYPAPMFLFPFLPAFHLSMRCARGCIVYSYQSFPLEDTHLVLPFSIFTASFLESTSGYANCNRMVSRMYPFFKFVQEGRCCSRVRERERGDNDPPPQGVCSYMLSLPRPRWSRPRRDTQCGVTARVTRKRKRVTTLRAEIDAEARSGVP